MQGEILVKDGRYWLLLGREGAQWQIDVNDLILAIQDRERELLREEVRLYQQELTREVERRQSAEREVGDLQNKLDRAQDWIRKAMEAARDAGKTTE